MNFLPQKAKIFKIKKIAEDIKIYNLKTYQPVFHKPCQFYFLGLLGIGEAPFVPINIPKNKIQKNLIFAIRKVGTVTTALDNLKTGDDIWYRGPYGNGFPINKVLGDDMILVAGGTGIVPIVSLIEELLKNPQKYGKIFLLYGAKTPAEFLFSEKFPSWRKHLKLFLAAQEAPAAWPQHHGMVTDLCSKFTTTPKKTSSFICGPPPMFGPVIDQLKKCHQIPDEKIYVSLEARMKCGLGKCQHCTIDEKYVCLDGPVFSWDKIRSNFE